MSFFDIVCIVMWCHSLFQWHSLDRSEQAKYYEMARKEKELHLQLYPGWSARDNYATHTKKKKRKKDIGPGSDKGMRPEDRYLDNPAFGKYRYNGNACGCCH